MHHAQVLATVFRVGESKHRRLQPIMTKAMQSMDLARDIASSWARAGRTS
jgi:hypothetical protein